jgi:hypothetical protein
VPQLGWEASASGRGARTHAGSPGGLEVWPRLPVPSVATYHSRVFSSLQHSLLKFSSIPTRPSRTQVCTSRVSDIGLIGGQAPSEPQWRQRRGFWRP